MNEVMERLNKEWAKLCAENPDKAEYFAQVLRGEKPPVRDEKPREYRVTQETKEKPLERSPEPLTADEAHRRGCEGVLNYFRGVAEEKGWTQNGES